MPSLIRTSQVTTSLPSLRERRREEDLVGKSTLGIDLTSTAKGFQCQDCLKSGGWWLHLRRCAECGQIGCCDSSPGQHARKHALECEHPVVVSFEPLQPWFFNYKTQRVFRGPRLSSPRSRPLHQSVPGPSDRVPENWMELLWDV